MVHGYGCDEAETPIKKCKCGSTDHKRTTHKSCPLRSAFYGERKSDPAPASDVMLTSTDECLSESDSEQLDYDYEESTDSDDLGIHPCTCPNYPHHKWHCPDNVRNRKRANDGCVTPSGTSWPLSRDNNTHSTPALDVTPSGTLWTPPLKRDLVRCSSPLLSQDKGQSTPATIACPLSTLLTTPLKPISLALVNCPTPSHVRGQGTPAVNVTPSCTLMTPPLKPMQLVVPKCPSPLIVSQVKGQSTPAVNKSFAQKVHSPTPSSNRTMRHSPVISNIKEQMISPSVSLKRQLKSSEQSDLDCFVDEEKTNDVCLSESDSEQLDYDYEESTDSDDLGIHPCTCPNYPRHKWHCPDNVRNRKRANDGCVTPSGTSWPLSRDNNTHSIPALDVTPSGTLWTPPLKRDLVRCSSPLLLSQDKGQSTPATIACPLSTLLTTPLKPISLALVNCPTPSHVRGQGTPAVNVTPSCTLMTPPLKPMQLVVPKCPSPLIVSQQSTPAVNKSFAQKVHSPTPSSNRTMGHSPVISNIKEQMISPSVSLKRQLKSSEQSDLDCFVDEEKTKCAQKVVHEMLPPPSTNKKWVQEAVAIISKFSGMNVVERKDPVTRIPCSEIAPHIRDEIVGDGAFFSGHYPKPLLVLKQITMQFVCPC